MAKFRYVNTKFWSDSYILNLKSEEKLLFLYFLTNPHTDICGIYELPFQYITFETDLTEGVIKSILRKFEKDKKIFYIEGWLAVVNFARHQLKNPSVQKGIEAGIANAPVELIEKIRQSVTDSDSLSYINININNNLNSNINNNIKYVAKDDKTVKAKKKNSKKELFKNPTVMGLSEGIKWLKADPKKHIQIIGDYAETLKPDLRTKGQWYEFIDRNVKAASRLSIYEKDQIEIAFSKMANDMKNDKNPRGFITKWTLETLIKYL